MKPLKKFIIIVTILFLLFLLMKHFNEIKETFISPGPSDYTTNSITGDMDNMNVVIISFYYSDTCPISREFLYGCCINETRDIIQEKNQDTNDIHSADSYGQRLRYKFSEGVEPINITMDTSSSGKCLPVSYFTEEGNNNNKCYIKKKPTYYYLAEFIKEFNTNYSKDINYDTIRNKSFEDNNGVIIDDTNIVAQTNNLKFKIRLKVEEYSKSDEIASLFIEIPRTPGLKEGDNVIRSKHRYLGNLNNMNEIGEFFNKFLNIRMGRGKESDDISIKYFHTDISQNTNSYKKELITENLDGINTDIIGKDYIAYLYEQEQGKEDSFKLDNLINNSEFSHIAPKVTIYDFNETSRENDINNRIMENNYLTTRPKILWKNICTFPEPNNEYIAIILRDNVLTENYKDDKDTNNEKVIYWLMWNIPKSRMNLSELQYETEINSNGELTNGVRVASELYPYKILDNNKNQYYFDENNKSARDYKLNAPSDSNIDPDDQLELFNIEDRQVNYTIDLYNYDKELAKELDLDYNNLANTSIELFYNSFLNKLPENINRNETFNIKYKIEDINQKNDLQNFFKKSHYEEDTNLYKKTLRTFSYRMRYYKLAEKINISLEKKTYWVLYFNISNDLDLEMYINNELVKINGNYEYRVPYKTSNINISITSTVENEDYLVLKESKVPTYRLNWQELFYMDNDKIKVVNNGIQLKGTTPHSFKGMFKLENPTSNIPINYRVNFGYENLHSIKINNTNDSHIFPSPTPSIDSKMYTNYVLPSNNNQIDFEILFNQETILYNGTITPIEDKNDLLELNELFESNEEFFDSPSPSTSPASSTSNISLTDIKPKRISSIQLDSLGCDYKGEYTIQPVPTITYNENLQGNTDTKFAIRIYEEDKLKPLYLEWGIDIKDDKIINYELFKNNNEYNEIVIDEFEKKFTTQKMSKYNNTKVNDNCKKNVKYSLVGTAEGEKIKLSNLPYLIGEVEFTQDPDDENMFYNINEENKLYLIFNKLKEVWQLWKNDAGFLYSWVGEQKYPDSLFLENSTWIFAPKYDIFNETRVIDPVYFPTWYSRNTYINLSNTYETLYQKNELLKKDKNIVYVFQKNINVSIVDSYGEPIYDCNITEDISEAPETSHTNEPLCSPGPSCEVQKTLFTNTLFTLGKLEDVIFDYNAGKSYFKKNLKLELIPYIENKNLQIDNFSANSENYMFNPFSSGITDEEATYEYVLSEKIKQRYINHNLINDLVLLIGNQIPNADRENMFNEITDSLLIHRGNLNVLNKYFEAQQVLDFKNKYYDLEDEQIYDNKKPVINSYTLSLAKKINVEKNEASDPDFIDDNFAQLFEDYVNYIDNNDNKKNNKKDNKIYFENYQSYGNLGIYQNETSLQYIIPTVEKIDQLCPVFRHYIAKTQGTQNKDLIHKTNIIIVINYCIIFYSIFTTYSNGIGISLENIFETEKYGEISSTVKGVQFEPEDYNPADDGTNADDETLKSIINQIQKIKDEDLDLQHQISEAPCPSNTDCEINCPSTSPSESSTDCVNKLKYLRDIYIIYKFTKKIKEMILSDINELFEQSTEYNIKELLGIMERFYIMSLDKHNKYFEMKNSIFSKMNPNDIIAGLGELPPAFFEEKQPKTYSETIDNAVNMYRTMIQNVFSSSTD